MKHLSYADVTIPLPTPQLEREWLARVHPPYDFTDFDGQNFNFPFQPSVPTPPVPRPTEFRLNTLFWPTAASRPAWFHFVCPTDRLETIRTAVGDTAVPAPLVMYDGRSGKTITAQMAVVGERPFNITTGDDTETFWLVTLSDVRYYWYMARGVVTAPSSWTNLFSQLSGLIGTAIIVDTIDAGYGTPSTKWKSSYDAPGSLLDAAAYQVGQRVVVGLDGSVRTVNWETAQTASNLYFSTADAPISGGRVSSESLVRSAPANVKVLFGDTSNSGVLAPTPYVVTKTLVSLSVTGYGAATGLTGYHDTFFADALYTGSNAAALATYATAAATDVYGWRLSDPDVAWPGIEPWVPTGWEERVEWTITVRDDGPFALTTVRRGPWREFYAGDYTAGKQTPPDHCGSGLAPGCAPEPGSGSGSGAPPYCDDAVATLSTSFENLTFNFQIPSFDVQSADGRLSLATCSTETTSIGPFNPTSPNGGSLAVVKSVCPVYTTLCYTDCDGNPATIEVVTALKNFRTFLISTAAGPTGCLLSETDACCGSGSGGGNPEKCTTLTTNCGAGQSTQLTLANPIEGIETILYYDANPADGNVNRYLTADLQYELVYDAALATWVLTNLDTGAVWVSPAGFWDCNGVNLLAPVDPDSVSFFSTTPVFDCAEVGYICDSGECYGVPLSISDYATLAECEAACTAVAYACVDGDCVETVGGPYSTLEACLVACTVGVCCQETSVITVTVSGVSNGTDPDCDCPTFNRAWSLAYDAGQETWTEEVVTGTNCFGQTNIFAYWNCSGGTVFLSFAVGVDNMATYTAPEATWVCGGSNEMTLDGGSVGTAGCVTWPATLTVSAS